MITGCNTNVRHGGRTFHVQTEDSGRGRPHIISHVYHGGTIIASEKREYGEHVDLDSECESVDKEVRERIESQHSSMLKRLADGEFDAAIAERLDGAEPARATATTEPDLADAQTGSGASTTDSGISAGGAATAPSIADAPIPSDAPAASDGPSFGDGVDTQKPLDEVILEYLVKKARDRTGEPRERAPRARRKG